MEPSWLYWVLTAILIPGSIYLWNNFLSPLLEKWGQARIELQARRELADIEGEQGAQKYTQQMSVAKFEATQADRALERSTQLGQMERLTDLLQEDIIFYQEVIRSLLKMPDQRNEEMVTKIVSILDNKLTATFEERDKRKQANSEQ